MSDRKAGTLATNDIKANVLSYQQYYPFGWNQPGRSLNADRARFGFNTQEKSPEISSGHTTALFWEYDSRAVIRWNIDPKPNVSFSSYHIMKCNPIRSSDHLGDTLRFEGGRRFTRRAKAAIFWGSLFSKSFRSQIKHLKSSTHIHTIADKAYDSNPLSGSRVVMLDGYDKEKDFLRNQVFDIFHKQTIMEGRMINGEITKQAYDDYIQTSEKVIADIDAKMAALKENRPIYKKGMGVSTILYLDLSKKGDELRKEYSGGLITELAHENFHQKEADQGAMKVNDSDKFGIPNHENRAVKFEDKVRDELNKIPFVNLKKREVYDKSQKEE